MSPDTLFNLTAGAEITALIWLIAALTKNYKDPMEISMSALTNLFLTLTLLLLW